MFCCNMRIGFFILILALVSPAKVSAQNTASKKPTITLGKYKGLQISRSELVTGLFSIDSLMHFKEVAGVKGLPKLTAKGSYGTRAEITGTEDNVTKAQWIVNQPATGSLSRSAFTRMAFFVNILGKQEGATWFFEQMNNYNQAPTMPLSNIYIVDGGKLMFTFDPQKKTFTITVSTE